MKKITVIFRYDDYSGSSDAMIERRLFDLFREQGLPCLVGVVPFEDASGLFGSDIIPLSGAKAEMLLAAVSDGVVEPALHGYTHRCRPRTDRDGKTEFQGLDAEQQRVMLEDGKTFLEYLVGQPVKVFIPPYNSYDGETIRAMQHVGLSILSGAMFDHVPHGSDISFVPHTCGLHQVREAIESARASNREDVLIMALFHSYDFVESDLVRGRMDLVRAADILHWVSGQDDVEVCTVEHAVATMNLGSKRYVVNREFLRLSMNRFVPTPTGEEWLRLRYFDSGEAVLKYCLLIVRSLFAYGVCCLIGALAGSLIGAVSLSSVEAEIYAFTAVVSLNLIWFAYLVWRGQRMYFRAAQVSCNLLSILIVFLYVWQGGG